MPAPTPPPLPPAGYAPVWRDQRRIDADHLRLLAIFHYVLAGLGVLGIGFLALNYAMMGTMMSNPRMWPSVPNGPPPAFFAGMFGIFKWFYLFLGVWIIVRSVLNVLSGWHIARRRWRIFSLVVAGLDCLSLPFGTALGVFTLIVLQRDSVRSAYGEPPPTATPPGPAA